MRPTIWMTLALLTLGCGQQAVGDPQTTEPVSAADTIPSMPSAPATGDVSGTVLETFTSGGYTYVRLDTEAGEVWAAVSETTVAEGDEVTINGPMVMENFTSPSLDKTFDRILFGGLTRGSGNSGGAAPAAGGDPHAGLGLDDRPATASVTPTDIERADGDNAHTVAEINNQRAALAGSRVRVRGQVVKYNASIMGSNWIHLQDGSGDAASGTNDMTVTTQGTAAVGDVVVVEGTVVVDKDFGAGYKYAVLLEEATIQ